jgi:hypothetical protein
MRIRILASVAALAALVTSFSAVARTAGDQPVLRVTRAEGAIKVDGTLGDPGWKSATEVTTFYEINRTDSGTPPVATEAWITYDDRYLYVAFKCDDPEPSKIRSAFVERDGVGSDQDFAGVFLDARGDQRSALELFVNPRGIQDDGVKTEATGTEDFSPDLFWDAAAKMTKEGWQMEMRIPFSSLRYAGDGSGDWGIILFRNYPRDYRYQITNVPVPRGSICLLCREAVLAGIAGLPSSGHFVLAPYMTAKQAAVPEGELGSPLHTTAGEVDGGADFKWIPNADNAVDLTLNPDFSQVESDTAQISANQRFALFYPEKRPFFMEGVDLFQMPFRAVYTRTITDPRWGMRATGRVAGTDYTVLSAADQGGGSVIIPGPESSEFAPQDFSSTDSVIRLRRGFGDSYVGFLVTDRENSGGSYNRVAGADLFWSLGPKDRIQAQLLFSRSLTPDRPDLSPQWTGERLSDFAFSLQWRHDTKTWWWRSLYQDVGNEFRADLGFMPQVGYRRLKQNLGYNFYGEGFFTTVTPQFAAGDTWDREGRTVEGFFYPGVEVEGKGNMNAGLYYNYDVNRAGDVLLHRNQIFGYLNLSPSRVLSRIELSGFFGGMPDYTNNRSGHGGDVSLYLAARPAAHLDLQFTGEHQWVNSSRGGHYGRLYAADVARLKAVCTFTARAYLRAIVQWAGTQRDPALYPYPVSSRSGDLNGSLLYAYRVNWQTLFYVGYGDDRTLDEKARLVRTGRQVFFKISYAFQK